MIIPALLSAALVWGNLLTILSLGFTLTYITAKIPNFAHGTYVGIGIYVSYTIAKILKLSPYVALPMAFIVGGSIGVLLYVVVISVLNRLGRSRVVMTISTIAIQIFVTALLYIYAFWLREVYKTYTIAFILRTLDFKFLGLPGILLVSFGINISIIILVHYMLTRTKTGIAMRAISENIELAQILGIDINRIQQVSWFLTGGLACLAGSMLPLWFQGVPDSGSSMMTAIMAGSLLGGFENVYGAMVGGFAVGMSEILLTRWLQDIIGIWVGEYRSLFPIIILITVLLIEPKGLPEIYNRIVEKIKKQSFT